MVVLRCSVSSPRTDNPDQEGAQTERVAITNSRRVVVTVTSPQQSLSRKSSSPSRVLRSRRHESHRPQESASSDGVIINEDHQGDRRSRYKKVHTTKTEPLCAPPVAKRTQNVPKSRHPSSQPFRPRSATPTAPATPNSPLAGMYKKRGTYGRMDGHTDGRTDKRTDGHMDGRTDRPSYRDA